MVRIAVIKFLEKPSDAPSSKSNTPRRPRRPEADAAPDAAVGVCDSASSDDPNLLMESMGECKDLTEACQRLLDHFILPYVPPEALVSV